MCFCFVFHSKNSDSCITALIKNWNDDDDDDDDDGDDDDDDYDDGDGDDDGVDYADDNNDDDRDGGILESFLSKCCSYTDIEHELTRWMFGVLQYRHCTHNTGFACSNNTDAWVFGCYTILLFPNKAMV